MAKQGMKGGQGSKGQSKAEVYQLGDGKAVPVTFTLNGVEQKCELGWSLGDGGEMAVVMFRRNGALCLAYGYTRWTKHCSDDHEQTVPVMPGMHYTIEVEALPSEIQERLDAFARVGVGDEYNTEWETNVEPILKQSTVTIPACDVLAIFARN